MEMRHRLTLSCEQLTTNEIGVKEDIHNECLLWNGARDIMMDPYVLLVLVKWLADVPIKESCRKHEAGSTMVKGIGVGPPLFK